MLDITSPQTVTRGVVVEKQDNARRSLPSESREIDLPMTSTGKVVQKFALCEWAKAV